MIVAPPWLFGNMGPAEVGQLSLGVFVCSSGETGGEHMFVFGK